MWNVSEYKSGKWKKENKELKKTRKFWWGCGGKMSVSCILCNLHVRERMKWSALSQKMNYVHVHVFSAADKYLREFCERTPPSFSHNYEPLNSFFQYYIVLKVMHSLSSFTHFLFLILTFFSFSLSPSLSFSRSCCILLFTIISSERILLCIFLSSITFPFLVLLYSLTHLYTYARTFFQSFIKILIHTVELSRLASISLSSVCSKHNT